eukprot:15364748-Ditylum_brightwellii.AAC.2
MTTCKDENGANQYAKQPQCQEDSYCHPATSIKAASARTIPYIQATHHPSRCYITHLQALCTVFDNGTSIEQIKFQHGLQAVLKGQNVTQGPPSYAVAKTLLKGYALMVFEQAEINHGTQSVPHFKLCLDGVTEHMFPERAGQTQKRYMRRNLWLAGGMTVKGWVAQVSELNRYLKDFPPISETRYSHSMTMNFWTSWNMEYQRHGVESLPYWDLTQWTKG